MKKYMGLDVDYEIHGDADIPHPWLGLSVGVSSHSRDCYAEVPMDLVITALLNSEGGDLKLPTFENDMVCVDASSSVHAVRESSDCPKLIAELERIIAMLKGGAE